MDVPVERFDALLRDLVHYDLVTEEGPGQWRLRPAVESRLAQLAKGQRAGSTPDLRIGVSCMGCHALAVTRLHGGRYLCEDCLARTPEHGGEEPVDRPAHPEAPARTGASTRRLVARYRR